MHCNCTLSFSSYLSLLTIRWNHHTQAFESAGATITLTIEDERFRSNAVKLTKDWKRAPLITVCNVKEDGSMDDMIRDYKDANGESLDILVHSIAYAPMPAIKGKFRDITRSDFLLSMDYSAYSLLALSNRCAPLMENAVQTKRSSNDVKFGCSIIAMSYLGSQLAVPGYGVMGPCKAALESSVRYLAADLGESSIRVNAISAGPINTLAARQIPNFHSMLSHSAQLSPLQKLTDPDDVGHLAAFLSSDGASSITGQTMYVDCGNNISMKFPSATTTE
jgi:enoyl-[acyl-carrier protein] reductase I